MKNFPYLHRHFTISEQFLCLFLLLSIILRLFLSIYYSSTPPLSLQQDHYADYAHALAEGRLPGYAESEKRLLPGYPMLIIIISVLTHSEETAGLFIVYVSYVISVVLFYLLTRRVWLTIGFMFFPPIWVYESAKVATEPLMVCLLLSVIYLFVKKKYVISGLLLGYAFDVRLIAICLLASLLLQNISLQKKVHIVLGFALTGLLLFIFNVVQFGFNNVFIQFSLYPQVGRGSIGFIQIIQDIFRTIDWRQYRILVAGLFYLAVHILCVIILYKKRNKHGLYSLCFYWVVFSLLFIFFMGPTPLLEEFSRFTVPFVPALLISFGSVVQNKKLS